MDGENSIVVLVIEPGKPPKMREIPKNLRSYQAVVDDMIQSVFPFDDPVTLICGDNAKVYGKPLNRVLHDDNGKAYDVIAGTFFIAGIVGDDIASLQPEYIEKYTELFRRPEVFLPSEGSILVIPVDDV